MEVWSGLLLGLMGSMHCAGMCGPLVLAMPRSVGGRRRAVLEMTMYHAGKLTTYGLMGVAAGGLGAGIEWAGFQQVLSVSLGMVILGGVLVPRRFARALWRGALPGPWVQFRRIFQRLWTAAGLPSRLAFGLLNGLLPCGLVYVALGAAVAAGSVKGGVAYMLAFGLGTAPILIAVAGVRHLVSMELRRKLARLVPAGIALVALLLILRGLSLGIPFLSPHVPSNRAVVESCCPNP